MTAREATTPPEHRDFNRIISWFITIRWVACICVVVTIVVASYLFRYALPYNALYATSAALLFILFIVNPLHRALELIP